MPRKKKSTEAEASILPVQVQEELTADRGNLQDALQMARIIPLDTQEGVDMAGEMMAMAVALKAEKEEQRKSVTGPLNAAVKTINSWFKPVTETCDSIVAVLKARVIESLAAAEVRQDEALQAIEDAGGKASPEHLLIAHNTPTKPDNMTIKKVLVPRVVDFSLLLDQYKQVNMAALQAAVDSGEREILGVVIDEVDRAIVRQR